MRLINRKLVAGGGGGSYDTDAQDYFTRAEALGGSFDQSGSGYSEATVKQAISDFVAGLKTDGVWDDIIEAYLMAGVTWDGITTKLKYDTADALTNNGFVSGDYVATGSAAGITGDGASYLDSNMADSTLGADDRSFGAYVTIDGGINNQWLMGVWEFGGNNEQWGLLRGVTSSQMLVKIPNDDASIAYGSASVVAFFVGSRRGVNDAEFYRNGSSVGSDASTASALTVSRDWYLFGTNYNNGSAFGKWNGTSPFMFVGNGLTSTQVSNLSARLNTLMTALGCNVY